MHQNLIHLAKQLGKHFKHFQWRRDGPSEQNVVKLIAAMDLEIAALESLNEPRKNLKQE